METVAKEDKQGWSQARSDIVSGERRTLVLPSHGDDEPGEENDRGDGGESGSVGHDEHSRVFLEWWVLPPEGWRPDRLEKHMCCC